MSVRPRHIISLMGVVRRRYRVYRLLGHPATIGTWGRAWRARRRSFGELRSDAS